MPSRLNMNILWNPTTELHVPDSHATPSPTTWRVPYGTLHPTPEYSSYQVFIRLPEFLCCTLKVFQISPLLDIACPGQLFQKRKDRMHETSNSGLLESSEFGDETFIYHSLWLSIIIWWKCSSMFDITSMKLLSLSVENSTGYGIMATNILRNSTVSHSYSTTTTPWVP